MTSMRIGIVTKPDLGDARDTLGQLRTWLEARFREQIKTPVLDPSAALCCDGLHANVINHVHKRPKQKGPKLAACLICPLPCLRLKQSKEKLLHHVFAGVAVVSARDEKCD